MEENELDQSEAIKKWWKENGTAVFTGILLGLALLFGWRGWKSYEASQQEIASMLYAQSVASFEQGNATKAREMASQLLSDYSTSAYAIQITLHLARQAVEENNYDSAHAHLDWVIKQNRTPEFNHIARLRKARLFVAEKKLDELKALLNTVADNEGAFKAAYSEIRGDLAILEGRTDDARQAYKQALEIEEEAEGGLSFEHRELVEMKLNDLGEAQRIVATPPPAPKSATSENQIIETSAIEITEPAAVEPVEPAAETPTVESVEPAAETPAIEPVEPAAETPAVEPVEPAAETPTVESVEPAAETPAIEPVEPAAETPAVEPVEPAAETPTVESVEPAAETPTVEPVEPAAETPAIEPVEPAAETPTVESVEPAAETPAVEPVEPAAETPAVEPVEPAAETPAVEPVEPAAETPAVEPVEPAAETPAVEPVEPAAETPALETSIKTLSEVLDQSVDPQTGEISVEALEKLAPTLSDIAEQLTSTPSEETPTQP